MSNKVFIVMHTHERSADLEDIKLIGVYSTETEAKSAVVRAKSLPGFSATPQGFHVQTYELDKDHWIEGFVTVRPSSSRAPTRRSGGSRGKAASGPKKVRHRP
jgi:hypothetical protein